ncbi:MULTISPECIES: hypothetical protein [unclassified Mesorhizobium]|uniref:P-loop ATPase, Sll1717 family n=1 Tax=unclassified Mesorhizobium TaxID=325217 RepID=UPI000FDC52AC|nr:MULTISPECIES: hypothetical protein [unclassified Mesorhizobium]TGQ12336.1 hypothetical protein EN862_015725 [Mesorhizobium sp. M2E.F.Ca.ET.219.01.1.1]TGT68157.1 hypothetical protein EN809_026995 [Mesorhizobium sp. M2E.F.Ca.ET.166.01.1.1]TGW01161.1 hypothetical protein EN797_012305 [Mesorhizobium sp. M2E.F.Ca.ET.154.01.1.1]
MEIFGQHLPDKVRDEIQSSDVIVCDVTFPNYNVYYEAAFAIGSGKAFAPVVNVSYSDASKRVQAEGFFDIVGFKSYENSDELAELLRTLPETRLRELYSKPINTAQPLFLLDAYRKTDFRNSVVTTIKDSNVHYRSFDPIEMARFSSVSMVAEITASAGVVIPILAPMIDDSARHNLRGAFLAGLAHGLKRRTLLIQQKTAETTIPIDYRELVVSANNVEDVQAAVSDFAKGSVLAVQNLTRSEVQRPRKSLLQTITLGASAAENEFRSLESYFVETSEYLRTLRGEIGVVAGRKGSGKTAIFFMVRNTIRTQRNTVVTDLKPESHQLSLFRQELLKLVDTGVFDHTLAAFWYFVLLSETLYTILRDMKRRSRYSSSTLAAEHDIERILGEFGITETGDFTARINRLGTYILQEINTAKSKGEAISYERLTNIVFRGGITDINNAIIRYTDSKTNILLLFDNLDKGWPTNGVERFDIRLIRLMIETLDKIKRDFAVLDRDFNSVVFLRNDIYELMVEETPDRGKSGQLRIDWTDRAKLRQIIYRRLQTALNNYQLGFEDLWAQLFVPLVDDRSSLEYCIDHCLMRPRFLINIVESAIANGVNRGHVLVQADDFRDAVRQHSNYLISDFGYEIRDVSGFSADILYSLIGLPMHVTKDIVIAQFLKAGLSEDSLDEAFRLMLWYGVLGIVTSEGRERFVYDYEYSLKRLEAEARRAGEKATYVINSALHVALSM